jgi:hypothetical protein
MTGTQRRPEVLANPFFVVLLGTSALFVLTVLGYLTSSRDLDPAAVHAPPGPLRRAIAEWLDRNAPLALGVEFIVMLLSGIVAMATDHWFSPRSRQKRP